MSTIVDARSLSVILSVILSVMLAELLTEEPSMTISLSVL